MEHFHYRNKCQIGHFFMNFHYARYENVRKSVPPKFKNEASDHLKTTDMFKAELLQEGNFFLIHLFARDVLVMKKLEFEKN